MLLTDQLLSPSVKASASVLGGAAVAQAADGTIAVPADLYSLIAVCLGLAGVYAARLVTIVDEEEATGTRRSYRQTGPLTWVAILIICPLIWHFDIAIPWASLLGLGVGYSVRVVLRILGDGTADAARGFVRRATGIEPAPPPPPALDAPGAAKHTAVILPPNMPDPESQKLIGKLDELPDSEGPK